MHAGRDGHMPTAFEMSVYALVQKVPKGKVTTYKEIAQALGKSTNACRAIGHALHRNPFAPHVPCHRVVASNGALSGYAFGCDTKLRILESEGIEVKDGRIVHFGQVFFRF